MDELLRSCSWHAEKEFRRRGRLDTVVWVTEDAHGHRDKFSTPCVNAPTAATDAELLTGLAAEIGLEFAQKAVVRFAVAYVGKQVTVTWPVDPDSSMKPKTVRIRGVVIELHSQSEHVGVFREIISPPRGKPVLSAATELPADTQGSPYANVLNPQACTAAMDQLLGEPQ